MFDTFGPILHRAGEKAIKPTIDADQKTTHGGARQALRVLLVEDYEPDAALLVRELRGELPHATFERVDQLEALSGALESNRWDAVISDYNLQGFAGHDVIRLVKAHDADLPVIMVTGTIGEEAAVELLKAGADDYLIKGKLARLASAIKRQLKEAEGRRARRRAERALREGEAALRHAQVLAKLAHIVSGERGSFESWSDMLPLLLGEDPGRVPRYTREWLERVHPEERDLFREKSLQAASTGERQYIEYRIRHANGAWVHMRHTIEPIRDATGKVTRWFSTLQDITAQKHADEELRRSEALNRAILRASLDAVVTADHEGRIVEFNPAAERIFGVPRAQAIGALMAELIVPPRLRDAHRRGFARYLTTRAPSVLGQRLEIEAVRADGAEFPIELTIAEVNAGPAFLFTGFIRDITERKEAEAKIRRLNRVHAVLSGINSLIVRVRDRDELFREACRIAVDAGELRFVWIGVVDQERSLLRPVAWAGGEGNFLATVESRLSLGDGEAHIRPMVVAAVLAKEPLISNDVATDSRIRFKQEHAERGVRSLATFPLKVGDTVIGVLCLHAAAADFFDQDEVRLLAELAGDIAFALEYIENAQKIDYLAYYDSLTGLANRTLLHERLEQRLSVAQADGRKVALVIIDIERFKNVNDSLGRQAGDALLREFADRMRTYSRDVTWLARLEADRFAVIIPDVSSEEALARSTEERLHEFFDAPFRIGDSELRISARLGIAVFPTDGADADSLLRNAEVALKRAEATRQRYLFYTESMSERVAEKLSLESKLRTALEGEQFVLHYQPKVAADSGVIVGVEALIRWQDPQRGLVPPGQFIPLLEETGLILEVGAWALRRAALDHRAWTQAKLAPPRVAVNVSAIQLRERDFVAAVERAVMEGVAPAGIDLEITESLIMQDVQATIAKLHEVQALGISIAIDDFGTGYSSLGYLAKLPVQALKIDRSFITAMTKDADAMSLVQTIITLSRSLQLKVVAEGVETEEQAKFLRLLRCDEMQGYLFSKPLPLNEITALLQKSASS